MQQGILLYGETGSKLADRFREHSMDIQKEPPRPASSFQQPQLPR